MAELRFKPGTPGFPFSLHHTILRWSDSYLPRCLLLPVPEIPPPPLSPCHPEFSSNITAQEKLLLSTSMPCPPLPPQAHCVTSSCLIRFASHTHCLKLLIFLIHLPVYFLTFFSIYHKTGGILPILELCPSFLEQHCLGWSRQLVSVRRMNRRQVISKENQTQQCVPRDSATFQSGGNSRPCFGYFWMMEHVFVHLPARYCDFSSQKVFLERAL